MVDEVEERDPAELFIEALSLDGLSQEVEADIFDYDDEGIITSLEGRFTELFENIDSYFDNPIDGLLEQIAELNSELLTLMKLRSETLDQYRHNLRVKDRAVTQLLERNRTVQTRLTKTVVELERIPKWLLTVLSLWRELRQKLRWL